MLYLQKHFDPYQFIFKEERRFLKEDAYPSDFRVFLEQNGDFQAQVRSNHATFKLDHAYSLSWTKAKPEEVVSHQVQDFGEDDPLDINHEIIEPFEIKQEIHAEPIPAEPVYLQGNLIFS